MRCITALPFLCNVVLIIAAMRENEAVMEFLQWTAN